MRKRRKRAILLGLCTRGWLFCLIKSGEKDVFPRVPGLKKGAAQHAENVEREHQHLKRTSTQTNGQNQEPGFWKHDGTLMTNSLDSLLFTAKVASQEMILSPPLRPLLFPTPTSLTNQYPVLPPFSVWHTRGLAPLTNHMATTQQLLVGLACCQTHTASHCLLRHQEPEETPQWFQRTKTNQAAVQRRPRKTLCWYSVQICEF